MDLTCQREDRAHRLQRLFGDVPAASQVERDPAGRREKFALRGHCPHRLVGDAAVTQEERRELLASRSHRHHRFISDVAAPRQVER
eukprot:scaffold78911_cov48-Phaeocystis_antarctica.AAC.1